MALAPITKNEASIWRAATHRSTWFPALDALLWNSWPPLSRHRIRRHRSPLSSPHLLVTAPSHRSPTHHQHSPSFRQHQGRRTHQPLWIIISQGLARLCGWIFDSWGVHSLDFLVFIYPSITHDYATLFSRAITPQTTHRPDNTRIIPRPACQHPQALDAPLLLTNHPLNPQIQPYSVQPSANPRSKY